MEVHFICPYWGQEGTPAPKFFMRLLVEHFDGVEINLPDDPEFVRDFRANLDAVRLAKNDFVFIAQQVLPPANEKVKDYIVRMEKKLRFLVFQEPDFINSHTGKDFFSFDDNRRVIEAAENIAARSGIPVLHETHRGRFTFHAASLLPYLDRFPDMKLTGDISHWCAVSESLLRDQEDALAEIIPHIHHIHARIGYEQGPQVNDPFAPEWKKHLERFCRWWNEIIELQTMRGKKRITITPEFGPAPYMPTEPYSQKPLAEQWSVNAQMKNLLQRKFESHKIKLMKP